MDPSFGRLEVKASASLKTATKKKTQLAQWVRPLPKFKQIFDFVNDYPVFVQTLTFLLWLLTTLHYDWQSQKVKLNPMTHHVSRKQENNHRENPGDSDAFLFASLVV
jgi:hypothetical protein